MMSIMPEAPSAYRSLVLRRVRDDCRTLVSDIMSSMVQLSNLRVLCQYCGSTDVLSLPAFDLKEIGVARCLLDMSVIIGRAADRESRGSCLEDLSKAMRSLCRCCNLISSHYSMMVTSCTWRSAVVTPARLRDGETQRRLGEWTGSEMMHSDREIDEDRTIEMLVNIADDYDDGEHY